MNEQKPEPTAAPAVSEHSEQPEQDLSELSSAVAQAEATVTQAGMHSERLSERCADTQIDNVLCIRWDERYGRKTRIVLSIYLYRHLLTATLTEVPSSTTPVSSAYGAVSDAWSIHAQHISVIDTTGSSSLADLVSSPPPPLPELPSEKMPFTPVQIAAVFAFLEDIFPAMDDIVLLTQVLYIYGHIVGSPDWTIQWLDTDVGKTYQVVDQQGLTVAGKPPGAPLCASKQVDAHLALTETAMEGAMAGVTTSIADGITFKDASKYEEVLYSDDFLGSQMSLTFNAVAYVDALEKVNVESIAPESNRCPGCWLPFGEVDDVELPFHPESDASSGTEQLPPNNDPVKTPCGHM